MRKLLKRLAGLAAGLALAVPLAVAPAVPANAAALSCAIRILPPTQLWTQTVYTLVEVNCNQSVSFIGGYVSLYRDGVNVANGDVYLYNRPYAYKTILSPSCVPGNYSVRGYGFANLDGGAPDVTQRYDSPLFFIPCT